MKSNQIITYSAVLILTLLSAFSESMNEMWGETTVKLRATDAKKGQLFDEGNYAMFIHWGLYSQVANKVDGKTYYGIGEWIMSPRMAGIPIDEYKELASTFNPESFDADEIVSLAKEAGMKYIVITAKHHDGFAMYHSKSNKFNIVDATPWKRDPMKELSEACKKQGLGLGFYYSHNQDWTFPGGSNGPTTDAEGNPATFDDYFVKKCLPQVTELVTEYGQIELIWFDTPGGMPKKYVQNLVNVVSKHQPGCLISGRAGHDLGDYQTLGDMEVPRHQVDGLWESVDTTNDSWAYAWYDENWKSPKKILHRLVSCVARGGTYMLNVGPDGKGLVPEKAQRSLKNAGNWIKRYPQVVYNVGPSPYGHALPWGDITTKENTLYLSVFEWPENGKLYLPGVLSEVKTASILKGEKSEPIKATKIGKWLQLSLPEAPTDRIASVIRVEFTTKPEVEKTFAIDPSLGVEIFSEFGKVENATVRKDRWMEKFGEWVCEYPVTNWKKGSKAVWTVNVPRSGDYLASLNYAGNGRLAWEIEVEGGNTIQNQQNASHIYTEYPFGWITFPKAGTYKINVRCVDGETKTAKLKSLIIKPISISKAEKPVAAKPKQPAKEPKKKSAKALKKAVIAPAVVGAAKLAKDKVQKKEKAAEVAVIDTTPAPKPQEKPAKRKKKKQTPKKKQAAKKPLAVKVTDPTKQAPTKATAPKEAKPHGKKPTAKAHSKKKEQVIEEKPAIPSFAERFSPDLKQTPDSIERVNKWFTDAKYGAFIHFGVYSMLEGEYKGRGSGHRYSEWIQFSGRIPSSEYHEVASKFNPSEFDAKEWAKTFKECGLQYVVITSKHHDGFALFDSDVSTYNITDHTPFKRDLVKELCDACHAEGLKFGVYYSHAQDWDEPDAPLLNPKSKITDFHPTLPEDFTPNMDRYLAKKSLPQVEELVKNYPLDLIWFDTPKEMTFERAKPFTDMVRKHLPNCIINSRIIHRGKGVIEQKNLELFDYTSIADKEVPTMKLPLYVESPDSVSSSFGYKTKGKHYYHTEEEMIHRLVHTVCAGGNSLVNNGPMGNGKLDPNAVKLYRQVGAWLKVNGESIYGSNRNPFSKAPSWGDISISKDGKSLYLHVMEWKPGALNVSGIPVKVTSATFLKNGKNVPMAFDKKGILLTLPEKAPDAINTVIKLSLETGISE